jgi:hypothetical protein
MELVEADVENSEVWEPITNITRNLTVKVILWKCEVNKCREIVKWQGDNP